MNAFTKSSAGLSNGDIEELHDVVVRALRDTKDSRGTVVRPISVSLEQRIGLTPRPDLSFESNAGHAGRIRPRSQSSNNQAWMRARKSCT